MRRRLVYVICILASLILAVEGVAEADDDLGNLKMKIDDIKKKLLVAPETDDDSGKEGKKVIIDDDNIDVDNDGGGDANLSPYYSVNGNWSPWSNYGDCSKSCGAGTQTRTRTCTNPAPQGYGEDCVGSSSEWRFCNIQPCINDTMKPPYTTPPICSITRPCCIRGQLKVILGSRGLRPKRRSYGWLAGVKVSQMGQLRGRQACSQWALVTANFQKIDEDNCFGCLEGPYCGARMLKIELELSNAGRSGHLFDVGDSISNDGHRGDYNHQRNDAEVHGRYPHVTVYPSDECWNLSRIMHIENGIHYSVQTLTMYVSNEYVRITNSEGLDYRVCHRCLYALNGQPDSGPIGGPNEQVFIGLNRVVRNLSRVGYGVCSATFSWMCPWCE